MSSPMQPTACAMIIGSEILSGKTQDVNLQFLGLELAKLGIRLTEARVVPDDHTMIVAQLNECRAKYTYVFTTGGIGPTHDDITAECVASAFAVPLELNVEAVERLGGGRAELNDARLKMARLPAGATLIDNPISNAPGFRLGNVFVFAGIPAIARAMFKASVPQLRTGARILSAAIEVYAREGDLAEPLEQIAAAHPEVEIGSYPFAREGRFGASLVVRGTDAQAIDRVVDEITVAMTALGGSPVRTD